MESTIINENNQHPLVIDELDDNAKDFQPLFRLKRSLSLSSGLDAMKKKSGYNHHPAVIEEQDNIAQDVQERMNLKRKRSPDLSPNGDEMRTTKVPKMSEEPIDLIALSPRWKTDKT